MITFVAPDENGFPVYVNPFGKSKNYKFKKDDGRGVAFWCGKGKSMTVHTGPAFDGNKGMEFVRGVVTYSNGNDVEVQHKTVNNTKYYEEMNVWLNDIWDRAC